MKIEVKFDKIESEREERISNIIVDFVDLMLEFMETQKLLDIELKKKETE